MAEPEPYGTKALPELYKKWASTGMVANIGTRLVEVKAGSVVLEGNMTEQAHGFPTSRGLIVHGGAIATLADEALASVAFTLADEGETTTTADLKVDYYRPCQPGRLLARATVTAASAPRIQAAPPTSACREAALPLTSHEC